MKNINRYIVEKLRINKSKLKVGTKHTLFPKSRPELIDMIINETKKNGNNCSLNHIDVSNIESLSFVFNDANKKFNGDISEWDVSNVENMECMFYEAKFNQDISQWDVSKVMDMNYMFCHSKFRKDIYKWKVNPKCKTYQMFYLCNIKQHFTPKGVYN